MDYRGGAHPGHDAGPGGGQPAWAHARSGAEQTFEVAHPHAQPGAPLLDDKGNGAPRDDARPRPGSPPEATSQLSAKQEGCVGNSVSPSALPIVEGQRSKIVGQTPGRGGRPVNFPDSRERRSETSEN